MEDFVDILKLIHSMMAGSLFFTVATLGIYSRFDKKVDLSFAKTLVKYAILGFALLNLCYSLIVLISRTNYFWFESSSYLLVTGLIPFLLLIKPISKNYIALMIASLCTAFAQGIYVFIVWITTIHRDETFFLPPVIYKNLSKGVLLAILLILLVKWMSKKGDHKMPNNK